MGVVHGRRSSLRLHLVNVPRVGHASPGGSGGSSRRGCRRRVHPRVVLVRRRVVRRRRRQQVGIGDVGRVVVGVLVGVVRVSVVRVVVEAARVVVDRHRDRHRGRLSQRAHAALAAGRDVSDDASRPGDG